MKEWVGLTIAQVLAICQSSYSEVRLVDEPPGKLRAVELVCREGGQPRRVVLEIQYHSDLFSADRDWAETVVTAQKVVQVHSSTEQMH
jgi:hypothetical protein